MLVRVIIVCIFVILSHGSSSTTEDSVGQCPGKCLPLEALCGSLSEKHLCGKDSKCCLEEATPEVTTEAQELQTPNADVEAEIRFEAFFGVEPESLSTILGNEPLERSAPDVQIFLSNETLKCPGICLASQDSRFCGYPLTFRMICDQGQTCCISEEQAFKIKHLLKKATEDEDPEALQELRDIFLEGIISDLDDLICPYQCLLPRHFNRCLTMYPDRYCPSTTVCCEENLSVPAEPVVEECDGKCLPPQLYDWCKAPRVLAPSQNCRPPLLCCLSDISADHRSGGDDSFEGQEYIYVSPENFTMLESLTPDPLPVEDPLSGGRIWMVADPQSSLRDPRSGASESNRESVPGRYETRIPVSQDSEEYLIHDEASEELEIGVDTPCPGACMAYFARYLCFGNYTTYDGFFCPGESVCCAKREDVRKHEEYITAAYPFLQGSIRRPNPNCGKKGLNDETEESVPGEWCWQVAVIDASNRYVCGGALINSSWVVTTAQCVAGYVSQNQPLFIRAGVNDLSSPEENAVGQTRRISNTYLHSNYNPSTLDSDIALLKLQNAVNLKSNVCLVCLPSRPYYPSEGQMCTLTGYGFISDNTDSLFKMTEAEIPLVNELDCIANVTKALSTVYILPSSCFCAGHEDKYCQGTSGNPLVCKVEGQYELTGLVSWSVGCQIPDAPSVYVKMSVLLGWINKVFATDQQLYP